jgi:hypothetical protein
MDIRICQFFKLTTSDGTTHYYQNYFTNEKKKYPATSNKSYTFAPFRAEGSVAALNGDNNIVQVLFPNTEFSLALLQAGDGNRLSRLELTTVWLKADGTYTANAQTEYFVGIGASVSDTTIELRFRSAIDSTSSNFPSRTLNRTLVGPLPLDAQLVLQ